MRVVIFGGNQAFYEQLKTWVLEHFSQYTTADRVFYKVEADREELLSARPDLLFVSASYYVSHRKWFDKHEHFIRPSTIVLVNDNEQSGLEFYVRAGSVAAWFDLSNLANSDPPGNVTRAVYRTKSRVRR